MFSVRLLIVDSFSSLIIPLLGGSGPYGKFSAVQYEFPDFHAFDYVVLQFLWYANSFSSRL